ncbi:MAG: serine/threonine-protein kinase [Planctomycetaceae bacterium]
MLSDDDRHPVEQLAEEFAERIRAGDNPQIDDYCRNFPEHADMIRSVFPSIQMVERASQREEHHRRSGDSGSKSVLLMPTTLGDFQLIREIGRGGMGVVYEAVQQSLKRHVALKVISSLIAGSEKQLKRFRREAESAASLHHSHIVPVYGIGEDHGLQYYAMQLIDGVTLAEIIQQLRTASSAAQLAGDKTAAVGASADHTSGIKPRLRRFGSADAVLQLFETMASVNVPVLHESGLSLDLSGIADPLEAGRIRSQTHAAATTVASLHACNNEELLAAEDVTLNQAYIRNIARVMANVANAVDYAHRQGILHRDLKPANLILDRDGTIWVADFGLAKQADLEGVTQTGEIVGTLRYMAPEQLRGEADVRTDIYALGVTLYELLVLKPAVNAPQLLSGQSRPTIASLRASRPEIPADLETITLKACMAEPERRYQNARELEADLHRFLEDRPILARRVTLVERLWRWSKRNPLIASLSTATVLLLATIAIILGIANRRIQKVLDARNSQYQRAEQNLVDKTAALENVERERVRAETNLDLAISAFEEVFNNIAARGRSESLLEELSDEDLLPAADAILSHADVTLLETLLGFFDRLAAENTKDLSIESAAARRRVGDIQQQLGRLENAQQSYQTALDGYKAIAVRKPEDASLVLAQAGILHQMMMTSAKRGEMLVATQQFQDLRSALAASPAVNESANGRFVLATAINSLVSIGLRTAVEPRYRLRNPLLNRILPGNEPPPPAQNQRLKREAEANAEVLGILEKLTAEDSSSVAYRVALAQTMKDKAKIAQLFRDWDQANEAVSAAIRILEDLQKEYPASDRFKYELADTLGTMPVFRPSDISG